MKFKTITFGVLVFLFIAGCHQVKVGTDPYNDTMHEKEKLLMSKPELDIYRHLPDKETKTVFIADFWKRRDPSPFTEENELKDEFDRRVAHANKWFYERGDKNSGWDSDRGRVYILFGQPDYSDLERIQTNTGKIVNVIIWGYNRYQVEIRFIDEMNLNIYYLTHNSQLMVLNTQEKLQREWGLEQLSKSDFFFHSKYINQKLEISIPLENLQVTTTKETVQAKFQIDIVVFNKYKKIDEIKKLKEFSYTKNNIMNMKSISFDIPYPLLKKGRYYFDINIKNIISNQQYRDFLKFRR